VCSEAISDYTTPWVKQQNLSISAGLRSVVLFALDQFCLIGYGLPLGNGAARSRVGTEAGLFSARS
jgi:hypothetical protein